MLLRNVSTWCRLMDHRSISGIGHENTYGDHVYNKGASVAHSLRGYMGADDFFAGTTAFLEANQFSDVSSADFRDFLADYTEENLESFFENWVFSPGFVDFSIENRTVVSNNGQFDISLDIRQRSHYAESLFDNVPLEISVYDGTGGEYHKVVHASADLSAVALSSNVAPEFITINAQQKLNLACLAETQVFGGDENPDFGYARAPISVQNFGNNEEVWMRIENHFTAPFESQPQPEFVISEDRYWRVRTNQPDDFEGTMRLFYDGDAASNFYLDPQFFDQMLADGKTEDSLLVVHRPTPQAPWSVVPDIDLNTGFSSTNFSGSVTLPFVAAGDFAFAYYTGIVGVENKSEVSVSVFPNPAQERVVVQGLPAGPHHFSLHSVAGTRVKFGQLANGQRTVDLLNLAIGEYLLTISDDTDTIIYSGKIQKQ